MVFLLLLLKEAIIKFIFGMSKDDAVNIMKNSGFNEKSRLL